MLQITETTKPKYFIQEKLYELPGSRIEKAIQEITDKCDITRAHFYRWLRATTDDNTNVKTDYLIIIADVLDCTVADLINTEV